MATRLIGTDTADPRLPDVVIAATQGTTADDLAPGNTLANAKSYTDTLIAALDSRIAALEGGSSVGIFNLVVTSAAHSHIATSSAVAFTQIALTAVERNLFDADGEPFYIVADTPWQLIAGLDQAEIISYVADRKAQGFNTLQVSVLPIFGIPGVSSSKANSYGKFPFSGNETPDIATPLQTGGATDDDTSPNYDYWDHVRWTVNHCARQGMFLNLEPMFYGFAGETWRGYLTDTKATTYGTFLGTLLSGYSNVMYILGGDNEPVGDVSGVPGGLNNADAVTATNNMANAIRAAYTTPPLMTYHTKRLSYATSRFFGQTWYNVYAAYSNEVTWDYVEDEVAAVPAQPTMMIEAYYDGRAAMSLPAPNLSRAQLRAQSYWSYLAGARGNAYSHEFTCRMTTGWESFVDVPSADDIALLRSVVEDLGPQPVADARTSTNAMLASGRGSAWDTVASSAVSRDRTYGVAYFYGNRSPISVNLARFNKTTVVLKWVNPETGAADQPSAPMEAPAPRPSPTQWDGPMPY